MAEEVIIQAEAAKDTENQGGITEPPPNIDDFVRNNAQTKERLEGFAKFAEAEKLYKEKYPNAAEPAEKKGSVEGGEKGQENAGGNESDDNVIDLSASVKPESKEPEKKGDGNNSSAAAVNDDAFFKRLSEISGGEFKDETSFKDFLQKSKTEAKVSYSDPLVEKLDKYIAQGGTAEDFLDTQTIKWAEKSAVANVRATIFRNLNAEAPASFEDVELEFKHTYRPDLWSKNYDSDTGEYEPKTWDDFRDDPSYADESEAQKAFDEAQLYHNRFTRAAAVARQKNLDYQAEWAVPKSKQNADEPDATRGAEASAFKKEAEAAVAKINAFKVKVGDASELVFKFNPSEYKDAMSLITGAYDGSGFAPFVDDAGTFNHAKFADIVLKGHLFEKAISVAHEKGLSKGKVIADKQLKNIDFGKNQQASNGGGIVSVPDDINQRSSSEKLAFVRQQHQ